MLFDRVIFWGKMGLASCTPSACKLRGKSSDRLGQIRGVERNLNQLPRQRHWRNAAKAASGGPNEWMFDVHGGFRFAAVQRRSKIAVLLGIWLETWSPKRDHPQQGVKWEKIKR